MKEFLSSELQDIAIACLFWAVSFMIPFRGIEARRQLVWDVVGVVTAVGFAILVDDLFDFPQRWALHSGLIGHWYGLIHRLPQAVVGLFYLVAADFSVYWAHRSLHSWRLWPTHAWHHSPKLLYWASGLRGSFIDTIVLFSPYTLAYVIFPFTDGKVIFATSMIIVTLNPHFIHSNIAIPFTRYVERIFVTPRYHFVHHSANKQFGNSNFGKIFTLWDRLFGTYTNPDTVPADDALGLDVDVSNWRLLLGLPAWRRQKS